jgi:hypothetical protein
MDHGKKILIQQNIKNPPFDPPKKKSKLFLLNIQLFQKKSPKNLKIDMFRHTTLGSRKNSQEIRKDLINVVAIAKCD